MLTLKPSIRLLVAEDDEDDLVLLRDTLRDAGFAGDLHFVSNGQELLDTLRSGKADPPDAVLIDLWMPRKDGMETLEEIQSDPGLSRIPVVIMSGTEPYLEMLRKKYPKVLVDRVLIKPVTMDGLTQALKASECCEWNLSDGTSSGDQIHEGSPVARS